MNDFWALIANGHVWVQFPHVMTGAMATAAFFMLAISAWHLLRARDGEAQDAFRRSFRFAAVYALAASLAVMVVGHGQAQYMVKVQPMKMAAAEALWQTENPASMSLFTWGNEPEKKDVFAIRVPGLLSFLAHNQLTGEVKGIKDLQAQYERQFGPGDYSPPVMWTYWTFRGMVGAGALMLLLAAWASLAAMRERIDSSRALLASLVPALALPYFANSTGWLFTEVGRQPWIVFGLQKTAAGVSPSVTAGELLLTLVGFTLIYGVLMAADIYLLRKYATAGLPVEAPAVGGRQ
jgi:cytochrome d ubiquinol oxidase subunit I